MTDDPNQLERNPEITLHRLADGTAVAVDLSAEAYVLNAMRLQPGTPSAPGPRPQ